MRIMVLVGVERGAKGLVGSKPQGEPARRAAEVVSVRAPKAGSAGGGGGGGQGGRAFAPARSPAALIQDLWKRASNTDGV